MTRRKPLDAGWPGRSLDFWHRSRQLYKLSRTQRTTNFFQCYTLLSTVTWWGPKEGCSFRAVRRAAALTARNGDPQKNWCSAASTSPVNAAGHPTIPVHAFSDQGTAQIVAATMAESAEKKRKRPEESITGSAKKKKVSISAAPPSLPPTISVSSVVRPKSSPPVLGMAFISPPVEL